MSSNGDIPSILAREGFYIFTGNGRSMWPLIRPGVDTVEVRSLDRAPEVGDIVLFNDGTHYVLHRVMKLEGNTCITRGDNNYETETVPVSGIIAVMTCFWRGEKKVKLQSVSYRLYTSVCINRPALFEIIRKILRYYARRTQRKSFEGQS